MGAAIPREESSFTIKSVPPRPIDAGKDYWRKMDDQLFRMMNIAEKSYQTNRKINIIIVIIGIVLIANSIGYAWYKQSADAWTLFSGGIGIVAFATLFFKNPQESITKSLSNLAEIEMIYKSHAAEFETIRDYDFAKQQAGNRDLNEIISMDKELERITQTYADMTQKYLGGPETTIPAESKPAKT